QLPYFSAVIHEVRLSHGIMTILTHIAPTEALHVSNTDFTILVGVTVGMSLWLVHPNPALVPEPDVFRPGRWLEPGGDALEKVLVGFSKGRRVCLGTGGEKMGWRG
ncbi:cytochrome P450, partial [Lizonia empirigonia]